MKGYASIRELRDMFSDIDPDRLTAGIKRAVKQGHVARTLISRNINVGHNYTTTRVNVWGYKVSDVRNWINKVYRPRVKVNA